MKPSSQTAAILRAQWLAIRNHSFRRENRLLVAVMAAWYLVWYGAWAFAAYGCAVAFAGPGTAPVKEVLPWLLPAISLYWQFMPLFLAGAGFSLDLRKLLSYPIPITSLFRIETALRLTTAPEMLLVTLGIFAGLARNPSLPWWTPLPLLPFTALNLLLSVGVREVFTRLMSRKLAREVAVLGLVLLCAAPQVLLAGGKRIDYDFLRILKSGFWWPWTATATLNAGSADARAAGILTLWALSSWWFGRSQFHRSLRFDAAAAASRTRAGSAADGRGLVEHLAAAVSRPFRDPVAALVQKEVLTLARSPRFRLLFIMGFSFGLLIFIPLLNSSPAVRQNYLTMVTAYSMMLLGEVCFWNILGVDRSAAQAYFVLPGSIRSVLIAKNVVGAFFVALEVVMVAAVCSLLRFPLTLASIAEAFAVSGVIIVFLLGFGNVLSVRFARAVDVSQSWKGGSPAKGHAYLLLIYPIVSLPIFLAYGARFAFDDSDAVFYAVLGGDFLIAALFYVIALESASATAIRLREQLVESLSSGAGPVSG
ncbi:MAG TPA: hypothetical protein VES20_07980 [Bryobacteraceae bacterium]|nr:hypothetical protein [Bryobacteraceae bacterium]